MKFWAPHSQIYKKRLQSVFYHRLSSNLRFCWNCMIPRKQSTRQVTFQDEFRAILANFTDHAHICTDGWGCGNGMCSDELKYCQWRAPPKGDHCFRCRGLSNIVSATKQKSFLIFSDLLSVLLASKEGKSNGPRVVNVCNVNNITRRWYIKLCWIPGQIGVGGCNEADLATGSDLERGVDTGTKVTRTDFKEIIGEYVHDEWHQCCDDNPHNGLFAVQTKLGDWRTASGKKIVRKKWYWRAHALAIPK